jgi:hypothetical protein
MKSEAHLHRSISRDPLNIEEQKHGFVLRLLNLSERLGGFRRQTRRIV